MGFFITRNENGNLTVGVLVALGILAVVTNALMSLFSHLQSLSKQTDVSRSARLISHNLKTMISNFDAWRATYSSADNSSLACLRDRTDCRGSSGPIVVFDPAGNRYYNPSDPTAGFDFSGNPCVGQRCPLRASITYQAVCGAGPCFSPIKRVDVQFTLTSAYANKYVFNPTNVNFTVMMP